MKRMVAAAAGLLLVLALALAMIEYGAAPSADWGEDIENVGAPVNSIESEYNPEISPDELTLYFSSTREGGLGANDIWMTVRPSADDPWGEPVNLGAPVNTEHWETGPSLTGDGLELYFTSTRRGQRDLYVARRTSPDAPFEEIRLLDPPINTGNTGSGAYVSEDGLTIVFSSTRPGGQGDRDLYMATRESRDAPWPEPENLGTPVNTPRTESSPAMTPDKLVLFFHARRGEDHDWLDILVSRRKTLDSPWSEPVPLEKINTEAFQEGTPAISSDGKLLMFRSQRPGGVGNMDLWQVRDPLEGIDWPD